LKPSVSCADDGVWVCAPDEGLGVLVVLVEEAVDGDLEVDDGSEHAVPEASPGELGEEAFDSVQPRGRGRGEVEGPARVSLEPGADLGVLVSGVVVEDDVDDLACGDVALQRVEEADELLMAVALHVPAGDRAVEHVQRGEQRGRAVALVVVGHGRPPALLERQAGLGAVERLDLRLLVEAEHHGVGGWSDVEAYDVVEFLGEGGIVGELEGAPAMRGQPVGLPDFLHRRDRETDGLGHGARRPVRGFVVRRLQRHRHDGGGAVVGHRRHAGRSRLVAQKACDALLHEPRLPAPDRGLRRAGRGHDAVRPDPVGAQQHDPGAPDMLLRRVAIRDQRLKPLPVRLAEGDGYVLAHAPDSHAPMSRGIPSRTHPCRSIH